MNLLDGASRLYFIVGDPISQVKSPAGVTHALQSRGFNSLCLPLHLSSENFLPSLKALSKASNVDGLIITVPHKFAAIRLCSTLSPRAKFLGVVNTLRRNSDDSWHGDMFDGLACVDAVQRKGVLLKGKSALLVGAGGAGSAIAHALLDAGVIRLAIHDENPERKASLIARLSTLRLGSVLEGSANPRGFDIVINATPKGMQAKDAAPISLAMLDKATHVGDVVTSPEVTHLLAFARSIGCTTHSGVDMFNSVRDLMVNFLLHEQGIKSSEVKAVK
jgi:shikimate dehydrogenase